MWCGSALTQGPSVRGREIVGCGRSLRREASTSDRCLHRGGVAQPRPEKSLRVHLEGASAAGRRTAWAGASPSHLWGEDCGAQPAQFTPPGLPLTFALPSRGSAEMWTCSPPGPRSSHTHPRRPGSHGRRAEAGSTVNVPHSLGRVASALTEPRFITGDTGWRCLRPGAAGRSEGTLRVQGGPHREGAGWLWRLYLV